ncbi:uncharacterized protein LOC131157517 [Malania oleifera]|uniref:uncharacterized protein LOC131157517 n=1 Tax=Malania oleifera TaxID=397392 RepID=UPI0025ADB720|nr:uncharacterized protein LOC131157517 [Malania oleifera]
MAAHFSSFAAKIRALHREPPMLDPPKGNYRPRPAYNDTKNDNDLVQIRPARLEFPKFEGNKLNVLNDQVHTLEEILNEGDEGVIKNHDELRANPNEGNTPEITLHAMVGSISPKTMRLVGKIKGEQVVIIIDSGSTHNFVDLAVIKKLNWPFKAQGQIRVRVANGQEMTSEGRCLNLPITLQRYMGKVDVYMLVLAGCDMVLGVQWLSTLGPILWDFTKMTMWFTWNDAPLVLQGLTSKNLLEEQLFYKKHPLGVTLQLLDQAKEEEKGAEDDVISTVLTNFQRVFEDPKGLPPRRAQDHAISLIEGAQSICVQPYRYLFFQKEEIEKIIRELLGLGTIRPSQSPFSSPVLSVRKADGTWRMCVDYRAWNLVMVKDKFPIPVINELLDELNGANIFFKLDLRSSYHQIRVKDEDIQNTAFRTHEGHYEFLVMSFGLTNTPSTFQSLMNEIFVPFLRRFILVFFNDILIYSRSMEEHVRHLEVTLKLLEQHQLYAKRSKCIFGCKQVEYLGHLVSKEGVQANPQS